jgi:beta-galactosidase
LDDPQTFRVGQLPAHSDHRFYQHYHEIDAHDSSLSQSLNGQWHFHYAPNPQARLKDFWAADFDTSGFDTIDVPGHIELAGYAKLHYINTMYPWEGHHFRRPAHTVGQDTSGAGMFSTAEDNPVGQYVTDFTLAPEFANKAVTIQFAGVEQAMYLWLNGHFLGYAEDSFTPSEFDLTPYLQAGSNRLAVEVFKRSTAAYLEDQDFFRFFGIFRDVTLLAKPAAHIGDLHIQPTLADDLQSGVRALGLAVQSRDSRCHRPRHHPRRRGPNLAGHHAASGRQSDDHQRHASSRPSVGSPPSLLISTLSGGAGWSGSTVRNRALSVRLPQN